MSTVLQVHTQIDSPGGANRILVATSNRMVAMPEMNVTIATALLNRKIYPIHPEVDVLEFGGGSPSYARHWLRLPSILRQIRRVILGHDVDIVVFHSIPTTYWASVLRRGFEDVAFVWFAHDPNSYLNLPGKLADVPRPMRDCIRVTRPLVSVLDHHVTVNYLDHVIANSQFTSNVIDETYNIDCSIVHPGIEINEFEVGQEIGNFVLSVGQINRYKNFDVLLQAMADLEATMDSPPELIVAGKGPYREELVTLAESLGINDSVRFVGYVPDNELREYYARSLVTVYLPENEPFGLVPVEAMACGTPVIGLDSGGLRETTVDGETGILVPELSPSYVATAIQRIVSHPDVRSIMSTAARKRAVTRFSIEKTTQDLVETLRDVKDS